MWKNPIGYLMAILLQFFVTLWETRYVACFINLALVIFMFSFVKTKDIKNCVRSINESVKAENSESDIMKQLIVFIDMHNDAKELSTIPIINYVKTLN